MRWLVVGARGMLGQDLVPLLAQRGHQVTGIDRDELDITDSTATSHAAVGYDIVVNCAAYTAVDAAESDESTAFAVNAAGAANLARAARSASARLVHISTDYVFDGSASAPYAEDAPLAPRSAYGRTKAAGEWAVCAEQPDHLLVRTAFLYGAYGRCFPRTIARVAAERGSLDVVADQVGQPTWTVDLSDLVERLVAAQAPAGIYHGTSGGLTSWHGFAQAIVEAAGLDPAIVRASRSDPASWPAPRPAYSALGHGTLRALGVEPIADWAGRWATAAPVVLGANG